MKLLSDKELAAAGVIVEHIFSPEVDTTQYFKKCTISAGKTLQQHTHEHEHISIVAKGYADVHVDDKVKRYFAGDNVRIEAGKIHTVYAPVEVIWYCSHATTVNDPELIDAELTT